MIRLLATKSRMASSLLSWRALDVSKGLAAVIEDNETSTVVFDGPGRREVAVGHLALASYKVPRIWRFVDQFPQTASSKIQKYVLRELYLAQKVP